MAVIKPTIQNTLRELMTKPFVELTEEQKNKLLQNGLITREKLYDLENNITWFANKDKTEEKKEKKTDETSAKQVDQVWQDQISANQDEKSNNSLTDNLEMRVKRILNSFSNNKSKSGQDSESNDNYKKLIDLLNNPDFLNFLVNDPDGLNMFNEMMEAIKSDPFNLTANGINFKPDEYEIFRKLETTSTTSMIKASLGDDLNSALESVAKNNQYNQALLTALTEQAIVTPNIQNILNDTKLSNLEKLSLVAKETGDFVRTNMAILGAAVDNHGKLIPGLIGSEAITIVFGNSESPRQAFVGNGGIFDSLKGPANKDRKFAYFDISDPNSASAKLAQAMGITLEPGTNSKAAVITRDGLKTIDTSQISNKESFQIILDKAIQGDVQKQWVNPSDHLSQNSQSHEMFLKLLNGQAKTLDISAGSKDNKTSQAFANIYAKLILEKFKAGKDESIKGLKGPEGSLAAFADRIEQRFRKSEKSGLKHDRNSLDDTLTKFSGLDRAKVAELKSSLSGAGIKLDAMTTSVLVQAGITNASQIDSKQLTIIRDFQTAQTMSGKNSFSWYEQKLNEYVQKGILPDYVLKHKSMAEQIMNIKKNDGSTDNMSAFNILGSVASIAHILENPKTAYEDGEGMYVRSTIADSKDNNGAFGMNSGNHYMRGNEESAFSLLAFGKIGNISIYSGNGMTDKEFTGRVNRLLRVNDGNYLINDNRSLVSNNDNERVRGLGLKHVSEEGHGNQSGNHGVIGSLDSSDTWRFKVYASLVRGDVFSLNCVACSNLGGNNSYGHVVLNEMAKDLGKHVRLYALGAEVPTPPQLDRLLHLNGHIAPALCTNSDRLVVNQGQRETSSDDMLVLSNYSRDSYNISRASGEASDKQENNQSKLVRTFF